MTAAGGYFGFMASTDCIYRRTVAGQSAWETEAPIAAPLRRVLGMVEGETHSNALRRLLSHHTDSNVAYWLSQLEKLGLLETLPCDLASDLDFTGSLDLRK
jgi:hypothetical protein